MLYVVGAESVPRRPREQPQPGWSARTFGRVAWEPIESGYVRLLRRAAETTGGAYWPVESTTRLREAFLRILEASNARYVLRYEPRGVEPTGRHRLKVSVRRRGVEVRARQEYVVATAAAP